MNKAEAVQKWVDGFNNIPQEWVKIVAESDSEYPTLPMWGTMFIVERFDGEKMLENSRRMVYDKEQIDLDEIEEKEGEKRRQEVEKAIEDDAWDVLEDYIDEEMEGANCVLKDGSPTSIFIYEIMDEYVIGVNGAGFNFFDSVWPSLYDACGLHWHTDEDEEEK
jgi:hypothetical protein